MRHMGQVMYMVGKGLRDFDGETWGKDRVEGLDVDGRFISRHSLKRKSGGLVQDSAVRQIGIHAGYFEYGKEICCFIIFGEIFY